MGQFASLTSLNVIIGIAVLMFAAPRLDDASDDVSKQLASLQADYDWSHQSTDKTKEFATETWDAIQQEQQCCGLKSPDDWNKSRPPGAVVQSYPASCCVNNTQVAADGLCKTDKDTPIWSTGCIDRYENVCSSLSMMVTFMICLNMVLSVLACIVLLCKPRDHYYDYS